MELIYKIHIWWMQILAGSITYYKYGIIVLHSAENYSLNPHFPSIRRQCVSSCRSVQVLTLSMLHYICKMTTEAFGKYGDFESNFLASCNDVNCSVINRTISPTVCLCTLGTDHWFIRSKYCLLGQRSTICTDCTIRSVKRGCPKLDGTTERSTEQQLPTMNGKTEQRLQN